MRQKSGSKDMAQLAQLNIARMKYAYDGAEMQDFIDALDPVNETADASPGFVWRMISDQDSSMELEAFENKGWLVNMSVWQSLSDLKGFMSSPLHLSIMRRRAEWFEKTDQATMVLWWVDDGHIPEFPEAIERLEYLRAHGPSEHAFSFSKAFMPNGAREGR